MAFRFQDERDWFLEARLGLFIHWGIYSVDAWQEQDHYIRNRTRADYERLARRFNPTRFDPDAWLDLAEQAGMRYLCFTTKHIDGFCMWDSDATDYKITRTPYKKDVLALLADACHRRNVPLCLYYSICDMHHPNYPHAGRPYEYPAPQPGDEPDQAKYMDYVRTQVRELCTRYGKIHGFWWDANELKVGDPAINAFIRELQPGIVINDRGDAGGDFSTPERDWYDFVNTESTFQKPVEACQALGSQSWGHRRDEDYYTDKHILRSMAKILAKGGNYLLNTGPTARGLIAREDARMLREIGRWLAITREALIDVEPCPALTDNRDVLLTRRNRSLYVILHKEPTIRAVSLKPLVEQPASAVLLNTGEPIETRNDKLPYDQTGNGYLRLHNLPLNVLDRTVPVIRLDYTYDIRA